MKLFENIYCISTQYKDNIFGKNLDLFIILEIEHNVDIEDEDLGI